jgi:hypothetical protein
MLIIFEFRDPTPIEAFVLASDYDRASEMFRLHLLAHGGDPDTLLYRQWPLDYLGKLEQSNVREALALHREGLLTWDLEGRWIFATPLGDHLQSE